MDGDKRQATLQVCLRARGSQPRPGIIFRGAGRFLKSERPLYDKVIMMFYVNCIDNIGWKFGQIQGFQKTGAFKGHYSVYYKSDKTTYYHALLLEEYGDDKSWVALVQ